MKLRKKKNQSGFTLIELLVVIILVTILAAVGIPLLTANIQRAIATEASASLSMVRTGMRAWFAEHATYEDPNNVGNPPTLTQIGIKQPVAGPPRTPGDLDGRYFSTEVYSIPAFTVTTFCAAVDGGNASNVAVRAGDVTAMDRSMNQDGTIFSDLACTAGKELN